MFMVCSIAKIFPHFVLSSEFWGHETCVLVYFLFFVFVQMFCGLICSRPLFQHIFNIAVPVWGHMYHLAQAHKPWKSELCIWITVFKNMFPLHPPQVALITDESFLSVVHTLLPMFLVCWGAWPILSLAIFARMNFTHSPQAIRSTCIDRRGGLEYCNLSLCDGHTVNSPLHNAFHFSAALPSSGFWQCTHCSPFNLNRLCVCVCVRVWLKAFLVKHCTSLKLAALPNKRNTRVRFAEGYSIRGSMTWQLCSCGLKLKNTDRRRTISHLRVRYKCKWFHLCSTNKLAFVRWRWTKRVFGS